MVSDKVRHFKALTQGSEALRFLIVGGIGFLINFVFLYVLHDLFRVHVAIAQIFSAEAAIISNYLFHGRWTYRNYAKTSEISRIAKFHATAWTGGAINSIAVILLVQNLGFGTLPALAIGSALGLVWNFIMNRYVVWAKQKV